MKNLCNLAAALLVACSLSACAQSDDNYLVGEISAIDLQKNYNSFVSDADSYQLSEAKQLLIKSWPKELRVESYFGVWCHDSEREIPRLIKLLSYNPNVTLDLYALDINKQDPAGLAKKMLVKYTPTVIVYIKDKEIGRIVERPKMSLVDDINQMIVTNKPIS